MKIIHNVKHTRDDRGFNISGDKTILKLTQRLRVVIREEWNKIAVSRLNVEEFQQRKSYQVSVVSLRQYRTSAEGSQKPVLIWLNIETFLIWLVLFKTMMSGTSSSFEKGM